MGELDELLKKLKVEDQPPDEVPTDPRPSVMIDIQALRAEAEASRLGQTELIGTSRLPQPDPSLMQRLGATRKDIFSFGNLLGAAEHREERRETFGVGNLLRGAMGGIQDLLNQPFDTFSRKDQSIKERVQPLVHTVFGVMEVPLIATELLNRLQPGEGFRQTDQSPEQRAETRKSLDMIGDFIRDPSVESLRTTIQGLADVQAERPFTTQLAAGALTGGFGLGRSFLGLGARGGSPVGALEGTTAAKSFLPGFKPAVERFKPTDAGGPGGFRGAAAAVGRQFKLPTIDPSSPSKTITKVTDILKQARPVTDESQKVVAAAERKAVTAFGKIEEFAFQEAGEIATEAGLARALTAMRGKRLPDTGFDIASKITPDDFDELMTITRNFDLRPTERLNNQLAFMRLFNPNVSKEVGIGSFRPSDLTRLERVFGTDLVDEVVRIRKLGQTPWEMFQDAINIPRALMSSFDLSAMGRQGRILGNGNPREFKNAFNAQMEALKSEKNALAIEENILRDPRRFWGEADLLEMSGVEITRRTGTAVRLAEREEAFMSSFARHLPWVRVSERAHVTFLNKLRSDVLYKVADDWRAAGKNPINYPEEWKQVGQWINVATGRGPLPGKMLKEAGPLLNAIFFSPRLNTARIATPFMLTQKGARGMAAKDLTAFTSTNLAILWMLETAGLATVKWGDPNSSDHLKAQIGPTRMDYWAGLQQYAVLGNRLMQQGITTSTGEVIPANSLDSLGRFIRYKGAPIPGLAISLLAGEDPLGRELTPQRTGLELVTPLAIQAIVEGVREGGVNHGLLALPEVFGVTVSSYHTRGSLRDMIAVEKFGSPYNEIKVAERLQEIDGDPRILAYDEEQAERRGEGSQLPVHEQLDEGMGRVQEFNLQLEVDLKKLLEQGASGKDLRVEIQRFKTARYTGFQANIGDEAEDLLSQRRGRQALKYFRDQYHSIQPEADVVDGDIIRDYDKRDREQEDVLLKAKAAGIPRDSITARSPDRFADEQVREVVEGYEADMETLRTYFDIPKRIIGNKELLRMYYKRPQSDWPRNLKRLVNGRNGVKDSRLRLRRRSATIEGLLLEWGFVTTPIGRRGR